MNDSTSTTSTPASSGSLDQTTEAMVRRKQALGFSELSEVDGFSYPTFFTASYFYAATGEGQTIGIVMGHMSSAAELRAMVSEGFGAYYVMGAEIWPRLQAPPERESLVPDAVQAIIDDPAQVFGNFYFTSSFHINQA